MRVYCESEVGIRNQVKQLLESAGYEVCVAANAEEAGSELEARQGTPKLLLADMLAGGMTGPEVANSLRKKFPDLPAVLFTGAMEAEYKASDSPNLFYVQKPVETSKLLAAVAAGINSQVV
jgi:CheY-like chemotaxis protein